MRRRAGSGWLVPTVGLAAAAAVAITLATGLDGGHVRPQPATAQVVLERVARVAASRPEPPLAPGEYFYVHSRSAALLSSGMPRPWSALTSDSTETWIDRAGNGRIRRPRPTALRFLGPRDRRRWLAAGAPDLTAHGAHYRVNSRIRGQGFRLGVVDLTYAQLRRLPTDGAALYRRLIAFAGESGPTPDVEAFDTIAGLLRMFPVPARTRAALYRAAGHIAGVTYAGTVRDRLGRRGLGVDLVRAGQRHRLIFDPRTSQLLADEVLLTRRVSYVDAPAGTLIGYRVVVDEGVVSSDRARPSRRRRWR